MRACDLQPGDRYDHPSPEHAFEVLTRDDTDGFVHLTVKFGTGLTDSVTYTDDYQLPAVLACPRHQHRTFTSIEELLTHLTEHIIALEDTVTSFQQHEDANTAAEQASLVSIQQSASTIIAELKAAAANGQTLDFTGADKFVADLANFATAQQAEATADAPAQPAPARPADGSASTASADGSVAAPSDGTTPAA